MRAFLIVLVVLSVSLLAAGATLLTVPALLAPTVQWAVARFTPMRVELTGLELDLRTPGLQAAELHLYQQGTDGPALVSVLDFQGSSTLRDLWQGNLLSTDIRAASIVVYVDSGDTARDPSPQQWLQYLRFLPRNTRIDSLHAINRGEAVSIFPLGHIQGSRLPGGAFKASAQADYHGEIVDLQLQTTALDEAGRGEGIAVNAGVNTLGGDIHAELAGMVRGDEDDLHYDFSVSAVFKNVARLLAAFPGAPPLSGSLALRGQLRGDSSGYELTNSALELDNAPAYAFEASGGLSRQGQADPTLALIASGHMDSFEHLLRWLDLDLSPLGSVRASIALSGTPAAIAVDQLTIVSESSEGLWITLNGSSGAGSLGAARLPQNSQFSLYVQAPTLATLNPWLAQPMEFDTGSGWLSARLFEDRGNLRLEDIRGQLGSAESALLSFNGNIASIDLQTLADPKAISGIDLRWHVDSPDITRAAHQLQIDLPTYLKINSHGVAARGRLHGNSEQLALSETHGEFTGTGVALGFENISAVLPAQQRYRPHQFSGLLRLAVDDTTALAPYLGRHVSAAGRVAASAELHYRQQQIDLLNLNATLDGEQTSATATGHVRNLTGHYEGNVKLDYASSNSTLLESLSGLPLGPVTGTLGLALTHLETVLGGTTRIGTTDVSTRITLAHNAGEITGLTAQIGSPRVQLDDLGLQAETGADASYRPVEQLDPVLERGSLQRVLESAPRYPLDLRINLGAVRGIATAFNDVDIHITGEQNQYLLREFDFSYADARAEIRGIVDISLTPPRVSIAGQALSIPLSSLGEDLGLQRNVSGTLNLRGGLSAGGLTRSDLLATLDGTLGLALEDATIEGAAYDVLATGLLNWLFSGAALQESTFINCAMAQFAVAHGVARTRDIFVESPNMVATGIAELDLPRQQISLTLTPRSRLRTLQIPSSINVRGDIASPQTSVSPVTATLDVYAEAVLFVPRLLLKIFGPGKSGENTVHPCEIMPLQ